MQWANKQDVTDWIHDHASEFAKLYPEDASSISMDKAGMIANIDSAIDKLSTKDRVSPEVREYESALLSYIHSFFCKNFKGRCYGDFNKKNSGAAFYALRFCSNNKVHNLSVPFSYSIKN